MPAITMPGYIETGGRNMRTDSSSTICRLTAQISTRSNGFGSSPGGNAYTTKTSHYSARSPTPSRRNSHSGQVATLPCGDYAQLLKTLGLDGNPGCGSIDSGDPNVKSQL